ncbi:CRISPR-associated protein Cas5 [Clostridium perfringens]|uniref:CRISPR-associated protein Cas5 n=1 Tax=Clostridium perfringens TaxID=1502 RepID=UPI003F437C4D
MKGIKITIISDMAHFKSSLNSAYQTSYKIPPISTVVGILKNIFGEEIQNIKFGYSFEYIDSNFHICTHKKVNAKFEKDKNDTVVTNNLLEYLESAVLRIYIIDGDSLEIKFKDILNLGKTDCLGFAEFEEIEIEKTESVAYNIYTEMMDGDGVITKITSETNFNIDLGRYMYNYKMVRLNEEVLCKYSCEEEGIYFWEYNKEIKERVRCYKELE